MNSFGRTFSIKWLLAVIGICAVFLAAITNANEFWWRVTASLVVYSLGLSLIGIIVLRGVQQACAIGFFVLGVGRALIEKGIVPDYWLAHYLFPEGLLLHLLALAEAPSGVGELIVADASVLVSGIIGGSIGIVFARMAAEHKRLQRSGPDDES